MRAVLQRVTAAEVRVAGEIRGQIAAGLVALIGVERGDSAEDAAWLAAKIAQLRIFADAAGKMNLAIGALGGGVLAISQFTLLADTRRGNRPCFEPAERPAAAREMFDAFVRELRRQGCPVATGVFGADMQVQLTNDGPVTICLDSRHR